MVGHQEKALSCSKALDNGSWRQLASDQAMRSAPQTEWAGRTSARPLQVLGLEQADAAAWLSGCTGKIPHLGDGGPLGEGLDLVPQPRVVHIVQHVDNLIGQAGLVQQGQHAVGEAALGLRARALDERHHLRAAALFSHERQSQAPADTAIKMQVHAAKAASNAGYHLHPGLVHISVRLLG